MIAQPLPLFSPEDEPRPRTGTRSGRRAVRRRRAVAKRIRYVAVARIFATVAVLTLGVVVYLALMANVTRMNYELARAVRERSQLVDETTRLDQRIAQLESPERLARVAAQLGLHEPMGFLAVTIRPERRSEPPSAGLAFLSWLH